MTPLPPDPEFRSCPGCGKPLRKNTRYCPDCGAYLNPLQDIRTRQRKMQKRWSTVKGTIFLYVILLSTVLPLYWFPEEMEATGMLIVSFVHALIILCYWKISGASLREDFSFSPSALTGILVGLLALILLLSMNIAYHFLLTTLFEVEGSSSREVFEKGGYPYWVVLFDVCLMPALWEETAFRGLIQGRLQTILNPREAYLITAILFAVIHVDVFSWGILFVIGLFLGWLRIWSRSLFPCMVVHFAHNLVITLL